MIDFVADESMDFNLVLALRKRNYNILSILEENSGISDAQVLDIATKNKALLLTEDKDFGELVIRLKLEHFGILLIRLEGIDSAKKTEILLKAIIDHKKDMVHNFSVLASKQLRIRQLK